MRLFLKLTSSLSFMILFTLYISGQQNHHSVADQFVKYLDFESKLISELPESNSNQKLYKREFKKSIHQLNLEFKTFFMLNYSDDEMVKIMSVPRGHLQFEPAAQQAIEGLISEYSLQIGMRAYAIQMVEIEENFRKPLADCSKVKEGKFRVITSDFVDMEIHRFGTIELRIYGQDTTRNSIQWTGPCSYTSTYLNSQYSGSLTSVIYNIEGDVVEIVETDSNYPNEYVHLFGTKF